VRVKLSGSAASHSIDTVLFSEAVTEEPGCGAMASAENGAAFSSPSPAR